jgi:hypothetical protein
MPDTKNYIYMYPNLPLQYWYRYAPTDYRRINAHGDTKSKCMLTRPIGSNIELPACNWCN